MTALLRYDAACKALAEAKAIDEVKDIRDKAEAMRVYARLAGNHLLEADATIIRVRAERRFGELELDLKAAGQMHRGGRPPKETGPKSGPVSEMVTLADLGVDKNFSSRAQKLATVPAAEFEQKLVGLHTRILESSAAGALDLLKSGDIHQRRQKRIDEMRDLANNPKALPEGKFSAGIADSPWIDPDATIGFNARHYTAKYPTMSPAQIAQFKDASGRPMADVFAETAFLALWITRHHLAIGSHVEVLEAWRFEPKTVLTWDKVKIGLGNGYVRDRTEHVVLAVRGKPPAPPPELRPASLFTETRSEEHSEKPSWLHEKIDLWFPDVPKIDLFPGTETARPGWTIWGKPHRSAA